MNYVCNFICFACSSLNSEKKILAQKKSATTAVGAPLTGGKIAFQSDC